MLPLVTCPIGLVLFPSRVPVFHGESQKSTAVAPRQHDSAAILQLNAVAVHAVPQQFLHAPQSTNLEIDLAVLLSSQGPPACGSWRASPETVKQQPDFRNGEACASSRCNYGQVELGIGREVPLTALTGSRRQDSGFFVKRMAEEWIPALRASSLIFMSLAKSLLT